MLRIFSMVLPLVILFSSLTECSDSNILYVEGTPPAKEAVDETIVDEFINPVLPMDFPSDRVVEPGEGFPFPYKQFPYDESGERSVAELEKFCHDIKVLFSYSLLNDSTADSLYDYLESLEIKDGSYGMPGAWPDPGPFIVRERIMLRKSGENEFEVFYYQVGCGINYYHQRIRFIDGEFQLPDIIEVWSESYPC